MMRNAKVTVLVLAAITAAGCAHSDRVNSLMGTPRWKSPEKRAPAHAPRLEPPKILPETHFAAACLHEQQGLIGEAINQYRKAIALNHSYVRAYHRLGVLLSRIGRGGEAVEVLVQAVRLEPDDPTLRNNLGYALMLQERWEDAGREFAQAITLRPYFARAYVNLGMTLSRLGRFDEAFASFATVLPKADAHYNIGLMLRGQGRHEEAADAFRKVLAINPGFTAASTRLEELTPYLAAARSPEPVTDAVADDLQTQSSPASEETLRLAEEKHRVSVEEPPAVCEQASEPTASSLEAVTWDHGAIVTESNPLRFADEGLSCEDDIAEKESGRVVFGEPGVVCEPLRSPVHGDMRAVVVSSRVDATAVASFEDSLLFDEDGNPCEDEFEQDVPEGMVLSEPASVSEPVCSSGSDGVEGDAGSSLTDTTERTSFEDSLLFDEDGNPCEDEFEQDVSEDVVLSEPASVSGPVCSSGFDGVEGDAGSSLADTTEWASFEDSLLFDEDGNPCEDVFDEETLPTVALVRSGDVSDSGGRTVLGKTGPQLIAPAKRSEIAVNRMPAGRVGGEAGGQAFNVSHAASATTEAGPTCEASVDVIPSRVGTVPWEAVCIELTDDISDATFGEERPCWGGYVDEPPVTFAQADRPGSFFGPPMPHEITGVMTILPVPAPRHVPAWRTKLRALETELASIRDEIGCWEETLVELEMHPLIDVCFADASVVPLPDGPGSDWPAPDGRGWETAVDDGCWAFFGDGLVGTEWFARAGERRRDITAVPSPRLRQTMTMTVVPAKEDEADEPASAIDEKAHSGKGRRNEKASN